jgi:hypothetical protein
VLQLPADLLWIPDAGEISFDPRVTLARLGAAASAIEHPSGESLAPDARERLATWVRERVRENLSSHWLSKDVATPQRRLIRRVQQLARAAARERSVEQVTLAQRAVDWLAGGLTAGEAMLVDELLQLSAVELPARLRTIAGLPSRHAIGGMPALCGAVRFQCNEVSASAPAPGTTSNSKIAVGVPGAST